MNQIIDDYFNAMDDNIIFFVNDKQLDKQKIIDFIGKNIILGRDLSNCNFSYQKVSFKNLIKDLFNKQVIFPLDLSKLLKTLVIQEKTRSETMKHYRPCKTWEEFDKTRWKTGCDLSYCMGNYTDRIVLFINENSFTIRDYLQDYCRAFNPTIEKDTRDFDVWMEKLFVNYRSSFDDSTIFGVPKE